jgi:hypothetical protein
LTSIGVKGGLQVKEKNIFYMEVNTVAMNRIVQLYSSIAILLEAVIAGLIALKSREVLSLHFSFLLVFGSACAGSTSFWWEVRSRP